MNHHPKSGCPDAAQLEAIGEQGIGEQDMAIQNHVASCPNCRALIHRIRKNNDLMRDIARLDESNELSATPHTVTNTMDLDQEQLNPALPSTETIDMSSSADLLNLEDSIKGYQISGPLQKQLHKSLK